MPVMHYLELAAIILGLNLIPAFGPPTWAVLVLLKFDWDLNAAAAVLIGAAAAGSGRYLLARATRLVRPRLSQRRRDSLSAAQATITQHRAGSWIGLGLFALSPLPSAQLFEAAGIMTVPLIPLTAAFFAGRLVSYSLYMGAASAVHASVASTLTSDLKSPTSIAVQVLLLAAVAGLTMISPRMAGRLRNRSVHARGRHKR
jgi:membrane protein YqaA with SNARE-associated domain